MVESLPHPISGSDVHRLDLRADCARCAGLCCVAPAFAASADFAIDKPAGHPCPHLGTGFGCSIHEVLRDRGFAGCTAFDCFGAGQKVVQSTFGTAEEGPPDQPAAWRRGDDTAAAMFDAFTVMRQLHELLWYLSMALTYPRARSRWPALRTLLNETEQLTYRDAPGLLTIDLPQHRATVNGELRKVSAMVRASPPRSSPSGRRAGGGGDGRDLRGADLIGKDLRGRDLRAADLRGAYLLGADLRGVDLSLTDLIGADLRGANVRGADLASSLFLTQLQVGSAHGDAATTLPTVLTRPPHWTAAP